MPGSAARRLSAAWQQLDPKPSTTSTAPLGLAAVTVLLGPPWSDSRDGISPAVSSALATTSLVSWAKLTVPVKASRVTPTTRAMTITAASGATGTPASPATATMPAVSRCAISAEARDKIRNVASTQAAVRAGGSRRHQAWPMPPWLSAAAVPSRIGTAARYGQENGSRATPNISVTTGDNTSPTRTVSTMQDTTEVRKRGRARLGIAGSGWTAESGWRGQANWIRTASTAARTTTSTTSTEAKPSQDWLNANSQRRSW